jgi:PIN domain nuclease of toxin-antitoxin system
VTHLLDTAPWINAVTLPETLTPRIRRVIDTGGAVGVCSVSLLETAILHRLRRLRFDGTLDDFFAAALSENVRVLELTPSIAARTNALPRDFPGDPFDRTVIATAATLNLVVVTTDPVIREAKACAVEYYPFKPYRRRERRT